MAEENEENTERKDYELKLLRTLKYQNDSLILHLFKEVDELRLENKRLTDLLKVNTVV